MTRAVAIVPLLLTAPASAQEFSCWPFKPNPPAGCRGEAHCACDSYGRCQRAIMLYGLVPDGAGRWSGLLYNIDNGNSYAGHLLELGPATIRVEGCAIGICGAQNMTRIK
jgi:uncharacterized protein (DUF2147 family)